MTFEEIKRSIAEALNVDVWLIAESTTAEDIEEWDSMGTMALVLMLNRQFSIALAPNETAKVQSVQGILSILNKDASLS